MKVKITITIDYTDPESIEDYHALLEEVDLWIVNGGPIPQTDKISWNDVDCVAVESDYKE